MRQEQMPHHLGNAVHLAPHDERLHLPCGPDERLHQRTHLDRGGKHDGDLCVPDDVLDRVRAQRVVQWDAVGILPVAGLQIVSLRIKEMLRDSRSPNRCSCALWCQCLTGSDGTAQRHTPVIHPSKCCMIRMDAQCRRLKASRSTTCMVIIHSGELMPYTPMRPCAW